MEFAGNVFDFFVGLGIANPRIVSHFCRSEVNLHLLGAGSHSTLLCPLLVFQLVGNLCGNMAVFFCQDSLADDFDKWTHPGHNSHWFR